MEATSSLCLLLPLGYSKNSFEHNCIYFLNNMQMLQVSKMVVSNIIQVSIHD